MIEMYHLKEKRFRKNSTRPIVEHLPCTGTRTSTQLAPLQLQIAVSRCDSWFAKSG